MRFSGGVASRLALALIIVASTLAITCATRSSIPNETVQLAQIRSTEAKLDRLLDVAIRTQLAGGKSGLVADDIAVEGNGPVDESGRHIIFAQKLAILHKLNSGVELSTPVLQRLRDGLHRRVDEAYASNGDLSKFTDLTSLRIGADGASQSVNRPAGFQ